MYNKFTFPLVITEHNKSLIEAAKKAAEELYGEKCEALSYSGFKLFEIQGSREEYEDEYMHHRKMLCAFTAMALLDEEEKWFEKLCDVIWAVCDEYTWALPAHLSKKKTAVEKVEHIDLFSAETSGALCEIYHIFECKLPYDVKSRIEYEIRRRIIEPYKKNRNKFGTSNWSAVCAYGVGAAFVYLGSKKEFEDIKENLTGNMQDFINSYTDDGCCLEGPLYWTYGFSHFCYLAELLREYTGGEIDYFKNEKIRKMAFFFQNINLGENCFVPFSDTPHTCNYDASLFSLLSEKYDGIIIPPTRYENKFGDFGNDSRYRFAPFIRNLYWGKIPSDAQTIDKRYIYYEDAEWYINKKNEYVFAAKSGHNDEPHNHNDVGSFIVFDSGKYIIEDVGWSKYNKDYFNPDKRYDNICASSFGHSVPFVNGKGQKPGRNFAGKVISQNEESFVVDLSGAYDKGLLDKFERSFIVSEKALTVNDKISSNAKVTSRFVTRIKPELKSGKVCIGSYVLVCREGLSPVISQFEYTPRFEGFSTSDENVQTAYALDYDVSGCSDIHYILTKDEVQR